MKENLTSQLVQAEHIAGKNIEECHNSSSLKEDYHWIQNCFVNPQKNFSLL